MAVRYGMYKAHYWTWTNSIEEFDHVRIIAVITFSHTHTRAHAHTMMTNSDAPYLVSLQGTDFCPGEQIDNVTTHDQVNHTASPVIIDLGRDPGEKYPLK